MREAVTWSRLDRPTFERISELLIYREHPDQMVQVIDGRGGDGGKDVEVTFDDGRVIVYQLKFFPEGFTGPWKDRRSQIRRSFDKVAGLGLFRWVLFSPNKFQPSEWAFVNDLSKRLPEGSATRVMAWDQAGLDSRLSRNTDLVDYLQRGDDLERLAVLFQVERAAMLNPGEDLPARLTDLGGVVDSVDPWWTLDFARSGSTTAMALRAKDPRAHIESPVGISFTTLSAEDSTMAAAMDRVFGYGVRETLHLTRDQFTNFTVTGTRLLDGFDPDALRLIASEGRTEHVPCLLNARDSDDQLRRQFRGSLVHVGFGSKGTSIEISFYDTLSLTFHIDTKQREGTSISTDYTRRANPAASPRDIEATAALSAELCTATTIFELTTPASVRLLRFGLSAGATQSGFVEKQHQLRQFAEDFIRVTDDLHLDLPLPKQCTPMQRALLRVARLVTDGKVTTYPAQAFRITRTKKDSSDEVLDLFDGQPQPLQLVEPMTIDFPDQPLTK